MAEGCIAQLITKMNRNYCTVFVGIVAVLISLSYFYRLYLFTVLLSYGLGCFISYIGLNSQFLKVCISNLKANYTQNSGNEKSIENALPKGCVTCGSKECPRHDTAAAQEPWVGLRIHKQLDQAIEEFYNTIIEEFISTWYNKITVHPFFVDEVRCQLRHASACVLRRATKINYARFITERLVPCALHHYTLWSDVSSEGRGDGKMAVHPAAANRKAELNYLRSVANAVMPYVLKSNDVDNEVFKVLVREIVSGWVLLSLTDALADPFILNTLVLLATGDETMAELPATPDYRVELLETFARQSDSVYSRRSRLLKLELDSVLEDQELFYAFMQYLKSTSHIYTLQFYKDIKSFQTKLLNPLLTPEELVLLQAESRDIYATYFHLDSATRVQMDEDLLLEMRELLVEGTDDVKKLQTSRALYQAARQSHALLEKVLLPKFLHSEEFYIVLIGSRMPSGYNKQMIKKPQDKLMQAALKLGSRFKGALKPRAIDGQVLDSVLDTDSDNVDILKYLDALASEHNLEHDLTCYKVFITDVDVEMQAPPRRGPVRVFSLCAQYSGRAGVGVGVGSISSPPALCTRRRTEHDFHLLHTKLIEFHGQFALRELPSRRDNSPLEVLRYKYEDYLQQLLQLPILQTSELLHLFLTTEADFSHAVQASSLSANSTDLINIYQSVAHRLKKEKGQHLESFLKNFLLSSDMERFQAIKHGIEEAQEVSETLPPAPLAPRRPPPSRHHTDSDVFRDNFGRPAEVLVKGGPCQAVVVGPARCLLYLLIKVLHCPTILIGVVGQIVAMAGDLIDSIINSILDTTLRKLLCERRLAHLIRLGHALIFDKNPSDHTRSQSLARAELARTRLQDIVPSGMNALTDARHVVVQVFNLVQDPKLNKQLVYELLDLCLLELFPELNEKNASTKAIS